MKLLIEHLKNNREALLKLSEAVSIADHPVNIGTAREGLISNFIQNNLPEYISHHTGEVFDRNNNRSGQIDIILHPLTSPKINLHNSINIFPAETVLAAIEVKSNLTPGKKNSSSAQALSSCKKLKKLQITGRTRDKATICDPDRIPFILFAYKGPTINTLKKQLSESEIGLRELPDLIVVLNRGYYLVKGPNWTSIDQSVDSVYQVKDDHDSSLLGIFEYILKLIEYWFINPAEHTMPIEDYTRDRPSLFDFFEQ